MELRQEMTSPFLEKIYHEAQAIATSECKNALVANACVYLGGTIPDDILRRIEGQQDVARLMRWAFFVGRSSSFDKLRTLLDS